MFVRSFLMIAFIMLTTGCAKTYDKFHPTTNVAPPHRIQQTIPLSSFTRIYMQGKFNVILHTGYTHPHVIVSGDRRDLLKLNTTVKNNILNMVFQKKYPRFLDVNVEIFSNHLSSFEYHGSGSITGNQLRTRWLDLVIDNKGRTILKGDLGLRKLYLSGDGYTEITGINSPLLMVKISGNQTFVTKGILNLSSLEIDGNSSISLYWIKSRVLTIRGKGHSFIQLAGAVEHLDVDLCGSARFNGRYLRAERAFVKTRGHAFAEVSAVRRQHTLAKDNSDIQFFNLPVIRTDFMSSNGAVLDMRDLGVPFLQEDTRYNRYSH